VGRGAWQKILKMNLKGANKLPKMGVHGSSWEFPLPRTVLIKIDTSFNNNKNK